MQTSVEPPNDAEAVEMICSLCLIALCLDGQDMVTHADSDVVLIFQCTYKHPREQKVKKKNQKYLPSSYRNRICVQFCLTDYTQTHMNVRQMHSLYLQCVCFSS